MCASCSLARSQEAGEETVADLAGAVPGEDHELRRGLAGLQRLGLARAGAAACRCRRWSRHRWGARWRLGRRGTVRPPWGNRRGGPRRPVRGAGAARRRVRAPAAAPAPRPIVPLRVTSRIRVPVSSRSLSWLSAGTPCRGHDERGGFRLTRSDLQILRRCALMDRIADGRAPWRVPTRQIRADPASCAAPPRRSHAGSRRLTPRTPCPCPSPAWRPRGGGPGRDRGPARCSPRRRSCRRGR